MSETLSQALIITAVGMGLVFAAIILLWILMALTVRFGGQDPVEEEEAEEEAAPATNTLLQKKRQAAAMAVAIALANQASCDQPHEFPLPQTAIVSAWQAIMRTRMLSKRGPTR
jgi:sodium pump decarboxylase gamma subunit